MSRPAVVIQANRWLQDHPSVTLCPLTSTLIEALITVHRIGPLMNASARVQGPSVRRMSLSNSSRCNGSVGERSNSGIRCS